MKIPEIDLYAAGTWTTAQHPVPETGADDYDQWLNSGGYARIACIGRGGDYASLSLVVWEAGAPGAYAEVTPPAGAPRYLVDVEWEYGCTTAGAARLPDLMAILAQWAPAVHAADLGDAAREQPE